MSPQEGVDGTVVAETHEEGVEFYVKDGHLLPRLLKVIMTMTRGEKAELIVQPQYAFGEKGRDAGSEIHSIPPNSVLHVNIELLSFKPDINVIGDSMVIKKILKEGESSFTANEGANVTGVSPATSDDVEDPVYHQLENTTHLLHGVVHANGYGHLLRVNGREWGSRFLSGCHIMDFWDRLCKTLGVRKVSVMDVLKKYGLEYRLLHAIMKGHPWYGDWGYNFGAGSYCLTQEAYESAIESLSNLPLSIFLSQEQKPHSRVQDTIKYYQSLSEHELVNMRDVFCFLMGLMHDARKTASKTDDITCKKRRFDASGLSHYWEKSDVDRVEEPCSECCEQCRGLIG